MKRVISLIVSVMMLLSMVASAMAEDKNKLPIDECKEKTFAVLEEMVDAYLRNQENFDLERTEIAYRYMMLYLQLKEIEHVELNYAMIPFFEGEGFMESVIKDKDLAEAEFYVYGSLNLAWRNCRTGEISTEEMMSTILDMYMTLEKQRESSNGK